MRNWLSWVSVGLLDQSTTLILESAASLVDFSGAATELSEIDKVGLIEINETSLLG